MAKPLWLFADTGPQPARSARHPPHLKYEKLHWAGAVAHLMTRLPRLG